MSARFFLYAYTVPQPTCVKVGTDSRGTNYLSSYNLYGNRSYGLLRAVIEFDIVTRFANGSMNAAIVGYLLSEAEMFLRRFETEFSY